MFTRRQAIWRYSFAFILVVAGIVFNYLGFNQEFLGFGTVGNWLVFVGLIMFAVITLQFIKREKRIVDERMEKIGYKASRITFLFIIFGGFIIMVLDGISKIEVSYSIFMSNLIALVVLIYFVSYKILEKYN
jgi:uncharacterized membrane protein